MQKLYSYSGGLVGEADAVNITNSYFSGMGSVSSSSTSGDSYSGGLVGKANGDLTITNSYFSSSGRVSASSLDDSDSGGLVGWAESSLTIMNSYFSGTGGIYSDSSASDSGGLVGWADLSPTITGSSYWNTDAPQMVDGNAQNPKRARGNATINPSGATGLTLVQLQAITGTHPSGLPNNATDNTKAWDLGSDMQLPAIKSCVNPTVTNNVVTCASYGDLLDGQGR